MKAYIHDIEKILSQKNAPRFIWLNSKENVLLEEARQRIKDFFKKKSYTSNGIAFIDNQFNWTELQKNTSHGDLFSTQHYEEYIAFSGKLSKTEGETLLEAITHLSETQIVILATPILDKPMQKTKWFETLEKIALIVTIWPLKSEELHPWLNKHAHSLNLQLSESHISKILYYASGNLIAAKQLLQRLSIQTDPKTKSPLNEKLLDAELQDESRFDVFDLSQVFLSGDRNEQLRILYRLEQSDLEPILVLWVLIRDIRLLGQLASLNDNERKNTQAKLFSQNQIWDQLQGAYLRAHSRYPASTWQTLLLKTLEIDKILKGIAKGNPWRALESLILSS